MIALHALLRRQVWLVLAVGSCTPLTLRAQNPELAPSDLAYSQLFYAKRRLVAHVTLQTGPEEFVEYQCERCPGVVKIIDERKEYARADDKPWLRSSDWGKTGEPVPEATAAHLDAYAEIAALPWKEFTHQDKSQGETVWKLKRQSKTDAAEFFTYEASREKPRPDGEYPLFTFAKHKNDTEGRLLLGNFTAQIRDDARLTPVQIRFEYSAPPPVGTVDDASYETWITGEVLIEKDQLRFRADKPVLGNAAGNVVLLGATKDAVKILAPMYVRAAQKHLKLRLYGILQGLSEPPAKGAPSVEFITWKVHRPDDPDELPADQKIILHEDGKADGGAATPPPK